jgi:hypothetical protein
MRGILLGLVGTAGGVCVGAGAEAEVVAAGGGVVVVAAGPEHDNTGTIIAASSKIASHNSCFLFIVFSQTPRRIKR